MTREERSKQGGIILLEYENKQRDRDSALQALVALGAHPVDAEEMLAISRGEGNDCIIVDQRPTQAG
jgi:hypothetical protein